LAAFVWAERRAAEPVLPPHLFRNRVFVVSGAVGLVVGFAMFGSITYLPLFLQTVRGASPTASGLQLLPMMGGMLVTSIVSGRLAASLARALPPNALGDHSLRSDPASLHALPPARRDAYLGAFTGALGTVFVVAACIGALGFALTWLLEERPLRETVAAAGPV